MGRTVRGDGPDTWHHVMNRGLARRVVFETLGDVRFFLSRLARAVRAGRIEVHAYCVLSTHFHLLLRSPVGELSAGMQSIENEYVRWFNRARKRDGPLFRSRFRSKPVESLRYRERLVGYIDANAVSAGLVGTPALHPHGSARWYAQHRGPIWLTRTWIESVVRDVSGSRSYDPARYPECFGEGVPPGLARLVERRIQGSRQAADPS
jgi:REP element-mobilizing transposase RayT